PEVSTIPVFVRPIDAAACSEHLHRDYHHRPQLDGRHHMLNAAMLLEVMSITPRTRKSKHSAPFQRSLVVLRMERMYVQEPRQYVY
ncbi:hypothetical protein OE165_27700, partial [Escherichia coli]|uniref:hypothetical protein n=1 Tax=Escherichia coli TaxID=562 RepID=UPI0021F25A2F